MKHRVIPVHLGTAGWRHQRRILVGHKENGDRVTFLVNHKGTRVLLSRLTPNPRTMTGDWTEQMKSLLGKQVRVTMVDDEREKIVAQGQLLSFDEGGEVVLLAEDGFIHYCWPNLTCEAM